MSKPVTPVVTPTASPLDVSSPIPSPQTAAVDDDGTAKSSAAAPSAEFELFPTLPASYPSESSPPTAASLEALRRLNVAKHNHDALVLAVAEEKELAHFVHSLADTIRQQQGPLLGGRPPIKDQYQALCLIEEVTADLQKELDARNAASEKRRRDVLTGSRGDRTTRPEYNTAASDRTESVATKSLTELEDDLQAARRRCQHWMREKMELEQKKSALAAHVAALEQQRQQLEAKEAAAAKQPKLRAEVERLENSVDTMVKLLSIPLTMSSQGNNKNNNKKQTI